MRKAWCKIKQRELLCDFIMCGLIVFFGGGFLFYQIMRAANAPFFSAENIRLIGLSTAAIFTLILLSGVSLYRISASYIQWHKGILDSIPMPVIITDNDAKLLEINNAAQETINIEQGAELDKLNCRHLFDASGEITKKTWARKGAEYRITGNRIYFDGKEAGHLIFLNNACVIADTHETRTELIDEINRLLGRLSTAKDHFHSCADTFSEYTVQQADIIHELSEVIVDIASGTLNEPDVLGEKIHKVKADMQRYVNISQVQMEKIKRTVVELDDTCNSSSGVNSRQQ